MDISIKHLKMIKVALSRHVESLEKDADQFASEELHAELKDYRILHHQVEELLLRQ